MAEKPDSTFSKLARRTGFAFLVFSAVLWTATTVCFAGVWDYVAAVTTFPQWSWAIIGGLSATLAWRLLRGCSRLPLLMLGLWLLTTLYFADNLIPVIRGLGHRGVPDDRVPRGTIRVATLNCASSPLAAAEVMQFRPDIVLLQEIPASNKVAHLAREWFGDAASSVIGMDCTIISHHRVQALEERPSVHYTRAILTLPNDRQLLVTSLRFTPPIGATDLWNPKTWRAYLEDRRIRTRQLRSVLEADSGRPDLPEIMGGDFNAPAGDGIYRLLNQYRDAHRMVGRGWGNTALNTIPLFRPDQIWLRRLEVRSCRAVRTAHSDHRMVVVDVVLDPKASL